MPPDNPTPGSRYVGPNPLSPLKVELVCQLVEKRNSLMYLCQLFEKFKYEVVSLVRYKHGALTLDPELMSGDHRQLTRQEKISL